MTTASFEYTASTTFRALAVLAADNLLPAARGAAVAKSLNEQAEGLHLHRCAPLDLGKAFAVLAQSKPDDEPPVIVRRTTCAELCALLLGKPNRDVASVAATYASASDLEDAAATWWGIHGTIKGDDGRANAMRATAEREAHELRTHISTIMSRQQGQPFGGHPDDAKRFA